MLYRATRCTRHLRSDIITGNMDSSSIFHCSETTHARYSLLVHSKNYIGTCSIGIEERRRNIQGKEEVEKNAE